MCLQEDATIFDRKVFLSVKSDKKKGNFLSTIFDLFVGNDNEFVDKIIYFRNYIS